MKNLVILVSLVLVTMFCSCVEEIDSPLTTGVITGTISDSHTGAPILGAEVTLTPGGYSFVTGSNGSFEFRGLKPGVYNMIVDKVGYAQGYMQYEVTAGYTLQSHVQIERIPDIIISNRDIIDFGNQSTSTLSFSIVNPNYQTLQWQITHNCNWIKSVTPSSGYLNYNMTETIVVVIDRDKLAEGSNQAVIVLHTVGKGAVEVTVKATGVYEEALSVSMVGVEDITSSSATLVGCILSDVEYTRRGFVYSTSQNPTLGTTIKNVTAPINSYDEYTCSINNLKVGNVYYVRAYAEDRNGTVCYSNNQVEFSVGESLGEVSMDNVSSYDVDLNNKKVLVSAYISDEGDPAYSERGFVYSTTNPTPTISDKKKPVAGSGRGSYTAYLTDVQLGHVYYVRAYLKCNSGVVYSGNTVSFSTQGSDPRVTTLSATDVSDINEYATLNGCVNAEGTPRYSECGFVYSDSNSMPTVSNNRKTVSFSGTGNFSAKLSYLDSSRTLYYRAYIKSDNGVFYGDVVKIFNPYFVVIPEQGIAVQRNDIGSGDWSTVNKQCENSTMGGYSDWRLPTIAELSYILDYTMQYKIGNFYDSQYWSKESAGGGYYYYYDDMWGVETALYDDIYCSGRAVRTMSHSELVNMGYR